MNFLRGIFFFVLLASLLGISPANAQDMPITQIVLIFDASNSMWGQIDGKAKIEIAREAMNELLKEFETKPNIYLGLRIYGHLNKRCDNSVLEIKIGKDNAKTIKEKIADIKAYHSATRQEILEKDVEVTSETPFRKQFKFSSATMLLSCVDANGKEVYTNFSILRSGTDEQIKADEGSGEVKLILPPGKYDIKAYNYDSRKEVLEKEIELKPGSEFKKQFTF